MLDPHFIIAEGFKLIKTRKMKSTIAKLTNRIGLYVLKSYPRESVDFAKSFFGNQSIKAIEVGTEKGINAKSILKSLNVEKIYLIDPYLEYEDYTKSEPKRNQNTFSKEQEQAERRLKDYSNKIVWINELSETGLNKVKEKVDFIYIDGNHEYNYVLKDLEVSWEKLKNGGILAGHDTCYFPVAGAVQDFCKSKDLHFYIGNKMDWWIIKK